jgi:hypothetical protein
MISHFLNPYLAHMIRIRSPEYKTLMAKAVLYLLISEITFSPSVMLQFPHSLLNRLPLKLKYFGG